jgi:16S rRNA (guanine527-N7)-methyltransferase
MELILKYFPDLTSDQIDKFSKLEALYQDWNLKINVVSRKDIDELYLRHVLHSLAIAKIIQFKPESKIMDVGTGGGFPGVPLAILFPESQFHLVDSINKKLNVVREVVAGCGIENIKISHSRVEEINDTYDFIVSRAVAAMPTFVHWVKGKIAKDNKHDLRNGIIYLKGGDLSDELQDYKTTTIYDITTFYEEEFFETKKVVHLPMKYKVKN